MKIHYFSTKADKTQIAEMLATLGSYIKLAVDIEKEVLSGGGGLHADCEAVLLDNGSKQENIWGADWIPASQELRFEALMNISSRRDNPSMEILEPAIRQRVEKTVRAILEGI